MSRTLDHLARHLWDTREADLPPRVRQAWDSDEPLMEYKRDRCREDVRAVLHTLRDLPPEVLAAVPVQHDQGSDPVFPPPLVTWRAIIEEILKP